MRTSTCPTERFPKDGPSAGLTVAVALASSFSGRAIRGGVAITGEVTLHGRVHAVGGIREKVLAAIRAGLTDVILPAENESDIEDVPKDALDKNHDSLREHHQRSAGHCASALGSSVGYRTRGHRGRPIRPERPSYTKPRSAGLGT